MTKIIITENQLKRIVQEESLNGMDSAFFDAYKNNDTKTAMSLVKQAAKMAMPNTKIVDANGEPLVVYHNTSRNFSEFNPLKSKSGRGMYFATNPVGRVQNFILRSHDMAVFLNVVNPYFIDKESGKRDWDITNSKYFDKYVGQENDGVLGFSNRMYDDGSLRQGYVKNNRSLEIVVFNPNQIKSANPFTFDDNGQLIPLSRRFDFNNNDIRY